MADLSSIAQAPYSSNPSSSASSLTTTDSGALGKEDFLKLLVTQLSNQDPMSPTDPTEFVSQLSQFSSLEQLMNVKSGLDLLAVTQTAGTSAQMVSFIGKTVSFSGSTVSWTKGDEPTTAQFDLAARAEEVTVTVRDAAGTDVRKLKFGSVSAGDHAFAFDGKDDKGRPLPTGTYSLEIKATDDKGNAVSVNQRSEGVVAGVTFESGYPELVLEDGRKLGLSQILEVLAKAGTPPALLSPVSATPTLPTSGETAAQRSADGPTLPTAETPSTDTPRRTFRDWRNP